MVISGKQALGYQSSYGSHTKAITMMVMGLDLANIEESHMPIIKSLSSNRKPLVIHLQVTDSAGAHESCSPTIYYSSSSSNHCSTSIQNVKNVFLAHSESETLLYHSRRTVEVQLRLCLHLHITFLSSQFRFQCKWNDSLVIWII